MDNDATYIHISDLSSISAVQLDDLLVVSHMTSDVDVPEYESCKVEYKAIKNDLYSTISAEMTSMTDSLLSSGIVELSGKIDSMISAINTCISACVALDNCRNKVLTNISWLSSYIDKHIQLDNQQNEQVDEQ